jgi:hypothetical protein
MNLCRSILGPTAFIAALFFGFSWIYWLRRIYFEVDGTVLENQRSGWMRSVSVPPEIHRVWDEHVRLFPESRNRSYAALSFLLFFLVPIAALIWCLLVSGTVP